MLKIYRTAVLLTLLCVQCIDAFGQEISVKSQIRELPTDLTARKYEKTDAQGKACAVIKVELPSLPDISFSNSVGDVKQNAGEYVLYVSPGITSIDVMRGKNLICTIDMEGVEIEAKHTYQVVLALKREKVFRVMPENAEIVVNGEKIEVDSTGIGRMNCEVGEMYNYTITALGYESISDNFMIAPDEAEVEHISKSLNRKTVSVRFDCNAKNIDVFVGMEHINKENDGTYKIPVGTQEIRIASDNYDEWVTTINVFEGEDVKTIPVKIEKLKSEKLSKSLRSTFEMFAGGMGITNASSSKDYNDDSQFGGLIGFGYNKFFTRWITFRPGIEAGVYAQKKNEEGEKICPRRFSMCIPIILSFNTPMGRLNQNHFSVGVGPILGFAGQRKDTEEVEEVEDFNEINETRATDPWWSTTDDSEDKKKYEFTNDVFVGGRLSVHITLNHFVLAANIDYQYYANKKVFPGSMIAFMATLGYVF